LNPVWEDEWFTIDLPWASSESEDGGGAGEKGIWPEMRSHEFVIEIYDHDAGVAAIDGHDFLGCVVLNGQDMVARVLESNDEREETKEPPPPTPCTLGLKEQGGLQGGGGVSGKKQRRSKIKGTLDFTLAGVMPLGVAAIAGRIFDLADPTGNGLVSKDALISLLNKDPLSPALEGLLAACIELDVLRSPRLWRRSFADFLTNVDGEITMDEFVAFCSVPKGALAQARSRTLPSGIRLGIVRAKGLKKEVFGKIDPYCVVSWRGSEVGATDVRPKTPDPTWAEEWFTLGLPWAGENDNPETTESLDLRGLELQVAIYDHGKSGKSGFLGCALLDGHEVMTKVLEAQKKHNRSSKSGGGGGGQALFVPHMPFTFTVGLELLPETGAVEVVKRGRRKKRKRQRRRRKKVQGEMTLALLSTEDPSLTRALGRVFDLVDAHEGLGSVRKMQLVDAILRDSDAQALMAPCVELVGPLSRAAAWMQALIGYASESVDRITFNEWISFCVQPGGAVSLLQSISVPAALNVVGLSTSGPSRLGKLKKNKMGTESTGLVCAMKWRQQPSVSMESSALLSTDDAEPFAMSLPLIYVQATEKAQPLSAVDFSHFQLSVLVNDDDLFVCRPLG
ncbi:MAG: C2 domain-containing protein, partial [Planctomycetota bacterium]|nr:C2 domain-containing protein [Planctomycetota bacterium]